MAESVDAERLEISEPFARFSPVFSKLRVMIQLRSIPVSKSVSLSLVSRQTDIQFLGVATTASRNQ